jgi:hypothetical protein
MKSIGLMIALSLVLLAGPALAAPPQLLNKTITVSYTVTGVAKLPQGAQRGFSTQVSHVIYVSTAGRLFMRWRASNSRGSSGGDVDPYPGAARGNFGFQGARMVGVVPFGTGARQITVTFNPSFSGCNASVIEGHSGGVIRRRAPDGIVYEITGGSTTSVACSVQSGNAFAGQ